MKRGKRDANVSAKRQSKCVGIGITCLAALAMSSQAMADDYFPSVLWDNSGADGNYSSTGWSTGSEPGSSALAAINNGATVTIDQAGEVADRLRLASNDGDSGFVVMTGGSFTAGTEIRIGDEGTGTWTQSGGDLVSENVFWIGARGPGYSASGVGEFNLSDGTVTVNGTSSTAMRVGRAGGTGILNISGGSWTTAGQFNIAAKPAATGFPSKGTLNMSGDGTLNVGTTLINDATGDDPGEALMTMMGSNVTVTTLSYAHRPDATLSFIADANGVSPITLLDGSGGASIQDGDLLIDLSAMTATPSTLVLIDNQKTDPVDDLIDGEFLNAPEGTTFGDYTLTYMYDSGDGVPNDMALVMDSLVGDLNGDGFVGIADLNIVLGEWNAEPPTNPAADPTEDGFVGIEDLNLVLGNWNAGTPPSTTAVPEPTSIALMLTAMTGLLRRKP